MSDSAKEIKLEFQKAIDVCDTMSAKQSDMMKIGANLASQAEKLCQSWKGESGNAFSMIAEEQRDIYVALLGELKSLELSLREIAARMADFDYQEAQRLGVQEQ